MERSRAVIASAIVAGAVVAGAAAYATAGAVTNGRGDDVGRLQATTSHPVGTTVGDPAPATTADASGTTGDRHEDRDPGRDRHGRDDDDD